MEIKTYCQKVSFSDEAKALFYVKKLQQTSKRWVKPVRAYLCEKCLNWHLTSESLDNFVNHNIGKDNYDKLKTKIENQKIIIKQYYDLVKDLKRRNPETLLNLQERLNEQININKELRNEIRQLVVLANPKKLSKKYK